MEGTKDFLPPSTALFPVPVVMVSCTKNKGDNNIITLAWVGILSSEPPIIGICVRPSRHSYPLIKDTGDFVVNIPAEDQAKALDYCGIATGRKVDKFKECGFTPVPGKIVKSPLILECPVNLECKVIKIVDDYSESHHLFMGEVVSVSLNKEFKGDINAVKAIRPIGYAQGRYWQMGPAIGKHGFSKARP